MTKDEGVKLIMDRYLDLYCYAFRELHSATDAEDAVQEAIAETLSHRFLFSPYGFCLRVLQRRCRDYYRSKLVFRDMDLLPLSDSESESSPVDAEVRKRLNAALDQLTEVQRQVVRLHDVEGLPLYEVAKVMNLHLSSVKKINAKAHQRLRKMML